jgi:membrane protein required for colicin V production
MSITAIDIIFIALIIIFTVRCSLRGFVSELLSMASVVLGLLAALYFYKQGGEFVRVKFMPTLKIIPVIIAFLALFLIVFICIKILESILKDIIEGIRLGRADRFLGIFFGLLEGIIVVSLALFVISIQPLFDPRSLLESSFFANLLLPFITGRGRAVIEEVVMGSGVFSGSFHV